MPARLIVNADDFGLTPGVNRAIEELHQAGVLHSTTLMANGAAFDDAVAIARRNPGLGVGCHVTLTDGVPVSHPWDIPSLLGADAKTFRPILLDFAQAVLRGTVSPEEIAKEALAQIQKLQRAGIDVTHVDTHKHTHLFPAVARPLLTVLERVAACAIRNPFEPAWTRDLRQGGLVRRMQLAVLNRMQPTFHNLLPIRSGAVLTTGGSIGVSATGDLNESTLRDLLAAMPHDGLFELVCHPGYNDSDLDGVITRLRTHRELEYQALLTCIPERLAQPNPPELIHYGSLGVRGTLRATGQFQPDTGFERVL